MIGDKIKFKNLTKDELIISLDRLSRFKLPEISFKRVVFSIISKNLISPKYSKEELENLSCECIVKIFEKIWNDSVVSIYGNKYKANSSKALQYLVKSTYKNYDETIKKLICSKIIIQPILNDIDDNSLPCNLKYLKKCLKCKTVDDIAFTIKKYSLKFPVRKLLIVEGITEEILLPVFAKKLGYDFDKLGVFVLGAGGKSKSPALYMELKDKLKIPVVFLFDKDAEEIAKNLESVILPKDRIVVIQQGEFEDILSVNLIKRTLNKEYEPVTKLTVSELKQSDRMCENISEFYKRRHLGEFKKSKLSKMISENIKYSSDISKDIKTLLNQLFI